MTEHEFNTTVKAIPNIELVDMAKNILQGLCEKGERSFRMSIPARPTDSDIILAELFNRFQNLILSTPTDMWSMEEIVKNIAFELGYDSFSEYVDNNRYPFATQYLFKAMDIFALQQTATITQELAEARKEIERLRKRLIDISTADAPFQAMSNPTPPYIVVDGACDQSTGRCEYKGLLVGDGQTEVLFKVGPVEGGTNNLAEFLAVVHALAHCEKSGLKYPVYTDSQTAIAWVRDNGTNSSVTWDDRNKILKDMCIRAIQWLLEHRGDRNKVCKWETKQWGENPADFGNKQNGQKTNAQELLPVFNTKDLVDEIIRRMNKSAVDGELAQELLAPIVDMIAAFDIQPMLVEDETFPVESIDDDLKIEHLQKVWQKYSLAEIETALPE